MFAIIEDFMTKKNTLMKKRCDIVRFGILQHNLGFILTKKGSFFICDYMTKICDFRTKAFYHKFYNKSHKFCEVWLIFSRN